MRSEGQTRSELVLEGWGWGGGKKELHIQRGQDRRNRGLGAGLRPSWLEGGLREQGEGSGFSWVHRQGRSCQPSSFGPFLWASVLSSQLSYSLTGAGFQLRVVCRTSGTSLTKHTQPRSRQEEETAHESAHSLQGLASEQFEFNS